MRKRLMAVLVAFVLMPLVSWSVTLHVGDEKFTPSDKTGYTYEFSSCAARASYSESKGFVLTFWDDSEILGNISWNGAGLNVKVGFGKLVEVLGNITSSGGGLLEINGPGTLRIINGSIDPYSADVKLFGAVVEITSREGERAISTIGSVTIELSCVSITGYGCLISGTEGVKIIASMVSLLSWPTSEGSQYAVIRHGNPQVGKPGGVSITGSVVSIVGRDTETAGILTRRGLLITESCLAIVSDGPCISVVHFQDGGMQYFDNVRLFAVSQNGNAFADGLTGETNYAYWGDGKYVLCAASEEKAAMVAKTVEIDEGDIELCSPQNYGAVAHAFLMKDGSFKMSGKLNKRLLREEILAESAVEGILTASLGWTSVQSEILLNMLANLDAALTTDVSGAAVSAVLSQEFVQTGGRMEQGDSACGHLAVDRDMARTKNGKTPAFTGGVFDGSFLMDYDEADPHPLVNAPTNALGQTLTHVEYEPYWVYLNGGVTPTGCRVVFNANGGQCSTTSRQVAKGAEIGTLPTATWSGYTFDGWYTSASGGTKVTATTKVTGDVTLYAHWVSSSSGMGDVSVTSVTAQKRYPWNGLVDITVTIQGTAEDVAEADCSFAAQNGATGESIPVAHITRNGEDVGSGTTWTRKFVWDVKADVGEVKIDDVVLTVGVKIRGSVQLWEDGPYWSECNVGATKPEEYGYYFWWGDTVGYMWEDREIVGVNSSYVTWVSSLGVRLASGESPFDYACPTYHKKGEELQSLGYVDSTGNLVAAHDAATAHFGASWRMPTDAEFSAMTCNCDTEWIIRNGVYGRLVKGRGAYASKSIFLPAAGSGRAGKLWDLDSCGTYWSSSKDDWYYACFLDFDSSEFDRYSCVPYWGYSVRPVRGSASPSAAIGGVTTHFSLDYREVTISFNTQGGSPTPLAITLYEGSEYGELPTVTRPGYTFLGWYTAVSGGRKILATDVVTADVTKLYARWADVSGASYTVRYYYDQELNPKKYTTQRFSVGVPQSLLRVKDIGWSMEGYGFVGWKERSHSGRYADGEEVCDLTTEDGDVVYLHACWEPIKYRTVFHKNDGSDEIFSQVHLFDSSQRLCDIKSIMGWSNGELEFVGWATRETGDVVFSNRESVVNLTSVQDGQIHLYAIWGTTHAVVFDPKISVPGEKVEWDTGLVGYTASGLPKGLGYSKTTGKITGAATKPTAAEGVVVKFTSCCAIPAEMTIVVTAVPKVTVALEGVESAGDVEGCKVTGAGEYLVGKTVTLKATAPKGTAFMGYYRGGEPWPNADDYRKTSLAYVMGKEDVALVAKFKKEKMTVGCDLLEYGTFTAGVACGFGSGLSLDEGVTTESGVKSIAVNKLPTGMKFDAKTHLLSGWPTKAGSNRVEIVVTANSGAVERKYVDVVVAALPTWAVGDFAGIVTCADGTHGTASMKVDAAGKVTNGKLLEHGSNWTFAASSFATDSVARGLGQDYVVSAVAKCGKAEREIELHVKGRAVGGVAENAALAFGELDRVAELELWRDVWKDADAKGYIAGIAG